MLLKQQLLFKGNVPRFPLCSNGFDRIQDQFVDTGAHTKPRNIALLKKYIQYNEKNCVSWLIFDVDKGISNRGRGYENANLSVTPETIREDLLLPEPTIFVSNKTNTKCHIAYLLEVPVHKNPESNWKPMVLLAAIQQRMGEMLGADPDFRMQGVAKNPLHRSYRSLSVVGESYGLWELADYLDLTKTKVERKIPLSDQFSIGRNIGIFDTVRKWSYRKYRSLGHPGYDEFFPYVLKYAEDLNSQECKHDLLPFGEIKSISKSIAKFCVSKLNESGFSKLQSERNALSFKKRQEKGFVSDAAPWKAMGISRRQYYYLQKKSEKRSHLSLVELPPWEQEGVSRSTYYRRRKNKSDHHDKISDPWTLYGLSRSTYYRRKKAGTLPSLPKNLKVGQK